MSAIKITLCPIIILSILSLTSCATPYQANGLTGGFKDMALNKDTYFIAFRGNAYTSANTVQTYTLRRAAELTVTHGYKYFIVLNSATDVKNQVMRTPTTIQSQSTGTYMGTGYSNGYGYNTSGFGTANTYTTVNPGNAYNIQKYQSHIVIKMLSNNKSYPQALDAKIILSNFKEQ